MYIKFDATKVSISERSLPKQKRSKDKLERIIQAAFVVTSRVGFESVTLADIAREAGVGVSTVYTRFKSKDALLEELHIIITENTLKTIDSYFAIYRDYEVPLRDIVREIIEDSLKMTRDLSGFYKATYQQSISNDAFAQREKAIRLKLLKTLKKIFLLRIKEIGHPKPSSAIDFFVTMYMGVITDRVMTHNFSGLTDKKLAKELTAACESYLLLE
ncbi:MAG: hypothetical protein CBD32_07285 [Actinobacteria bacterium TMED172]|nr:hypothetical protein [Cellvibrionales bacterium]OUW32171.1 MAG: hypothetical protein CBD32_07285 [Actinobacteria bacterium TMED172]|tara:strand:- start:6050 stop:6697 length:648 start_codon:yes stop_codon:yes gene_type:complete